MLRVLLSRSWFSGAVPTLEKIFFFFGFTTTQLLKLRLQLRWPHFIAYFYSFKVLVIKNRTAKHICKII